MKKFLLGVLMLFPLVVAAQAAEAPVSDDTDTCLGCHASTHPGIVEGWRQSRHAMTTPAEAVKKKDLKRKVSARDVPDRLANHAVGCAECHTLNAKDHKDTFEHNGYEVHVVVSPRDCATCHVQEQQQFDRNLMAHAYGNLVDNGVYQLLVKSINDTPLFDKGRMAFNGANDATQGESCLYCHGTKLQVTGTQTRETSSGEMSFPVIAGWPNQGTGRINLDGSRGACSACHTRHTFSIEMARKPYTCKECHVGPDVPAFKVYEASKHGNIFSAHSEKWEFNAVPWTIGKDFTAPTCAACHMSLLVNTDGEVVAERTHEIKDRLAYRIFGLIYAHPHPKEPNTTVIKNKDGLQLPTDFEGRVAEKYLLDEAEREKHRKTIQAACLACHDKSWVDGHWGRFENSIKETNASTLAATKIMQEVWHRGYAKGVAAGANPFDEFIEKKWSDLWLFYANSVRFASAMAGGGDYGVFAQGRYYMAASVQELYDWLKLRSDLKR
jgi:hydroxylamine dehydrogenase